MATLFIFLLMLQPTMRAQEHPSGAVVQPGAPGNPTKSLPAGSHASRMPVSPADVAFMQGMIMHHQQAVEMTALIPERTENKAVRDLGRRISVSQEDEIKYMKQWLEARGQSSMMKMDMSGGHHNMPMMPGMLTSQQMDALRSAKGNEFDRLFLTGMIQHHGGALVMVKQLFDTTGAGQDAELFDFATDVDNTQRAEISLMEKILKENK
jgi:uncharacterized protein (DUF305 family)